MLKRYWKGAEEDGAEEVLEGARGFLEDDRRVIGGEKIERRENGVEKEGNRGRKGGKRSGNFFFWTILVHF